MKKFIIVGCLFLTACFGQETGLAPGIQIPPLPANLSQRAEPLPPITGKSMGDQVIAGVEAERAYNKVGNQTNNLIDLYNCIRKTVNSKTDPKECFE